MTEWLTTCDLRTYDVVVGDARSEGRAPSHDGEYFRLIFAGEGCWIAESNGGSVCSDVQSYEAEVNDAIYNLPDDEQEEAMAEAKAIDEEIAAAIAGAWGELYPKGTHQDVLPIGAEATEYLTSAQVLQPHE